MPARLTTAPLPRLELALAAAIREHKADDPLAPVAVLIGGTLQRPYLQRRLATLLDGHANVALLTAGELALRLGEHVQIDQGRMPMPPLAARTLAGEVARDAGGFFAPVAHTPGFATALHRLLRELQQAGISGDALAVNAPQLPGSAEKHAALAGLVQTYDAKRTGWYGPDECLTTVDPERFEADALLVYGVTELSAGLHDLLTALNGRVPLHLFAPPLVPDADDAAEDLRRLAAELSAVDVAAPDESDQPTPSLQLVSSPDPTREARAAARACLQWAEQGIAFHEMAVAYRHADTYRPLVDAVFREAGIPVYLHEGTPLRELPLGRRVTALLDLLDDRALDRRAVMDLVADARLPKATRERYPGFSPSRWDAISRKAGIVRGLTEWDVKLSQLAAAERGRVDAEDQDVPEWKREEADRVDALRQFVLDLERALDDHADQAPFGEHLEALERLMTTYVDEVEPVVVALRSLQRLDALTETVSFPRFTEIVRGAVEGLRADDVLDRRAGAFGRRGVNVLDVSSLRFLRFRAVALLGLVERQWPSPARQDPLLLDDARVKLAAATGHRLPLRAFGADREPLTFALATGAAAEHLQASYPRTDRAGGRSQLPSVFLRAVASEATGDDVTAEEVEALPAPLLRREPAATAGPPPGLPALSEAEALRGLLEQQPAVGQALLRADARMRRAAEVERARFSRRYTAFDGVLSGEAKEALADHWSVTQPMSPTAAETVASCAARYFFSRVLRVRIDEEPEEVQTISPLTKGSIVHAALERFIEGLPAGEWPAPPLRAKHVPRLRALAEEACEDAEQQGLTGFPQLWARERTRLLEDLERWYDREAEDAARLDHRAVEVRFGPARHGEPDAVAPSSDAPLDLAAGGVTLRFAGRIDRIEWDDDRRFRVVDYKTGRNRKKDGDLDGGQALQLPIYVYAAAHLLGLRPQDGEALYRHVSREGGFADVRFTGEHLAEQQEHFEEVLGTLASAMAGGIFPASPGRQCDWCDFNTLCDGRKALFEQRKADDPAVAPLRALKDGKA